MSELRGVVYIIKSRGREQILARRHKTDIERRETTFTLHTERTRGQIRFEPVKVYSRTVPVIPNNEERRDNKMLWSIVSNAADRSQRQRHDIFESL